jgi:hypothetical protein
VPAGDNQRIRISQYSAAVRRFYTYDSPEANGTVLRVTNLRELDLQLAGNDQENFAHLLDNIAGLAKLESLRLHIPLGDASSIRQATQSLIKTCKALPSLRFVSLYDDSIVDDDPEIQKATGNFWGSFLAFLPESLESVSFVKCSNLDRTSSFWQNVGQTRVTTLGYCYGLSPAVDFEIPASLRHLRIKDYAHPSNI